MSKPTTLTEARRHLGAIVRSAEHAGDTQVITVHGREVAAVVPIEHVRDTQKLQDRLDHEDAMRALGELKDGSAVPIDFEDLPPIP